MDKILELLHHATNKNLDSKLVIRNRIPMLEINIRNFGNGKRDNAFIRISPRDAEEDMFIVVARFQSVRHYCSEKFYGKVENFFNGCPYAIFYFDSNTITVVGDNLKNVLDWAVDERAKDMKPVLEVDNPYPSCKYMANVVMN